MEEREQFHFILGHERLVSCKVVYMLVAGNSQEVYTPGDFGEDLWGKYSKQQLSNCPIVSKGHLWKGKLAEHGKTWVTVIIMERKGNDRKRL